MSHSISDELLLGWEGSKKAGIVCGVLCPRVLAQLTQAYGPSNMASMSSHWFHTLPSLALDHWGFACPRALAYARISALL